MRVEEPTNIRNTNDNATSSLVFFFFFFWFGCFLFLELAIFRVLQFPYFLICDLSGGLQIKAIQRLKQDIRYPTFPRGAPLGHINPFP